ncbi:hypothetical protein ACFE04_001193 [Oxalis oulophora]
METQKCKSGQSKLSKTFQKVISLKTSTTKNGIGVCLMTPSSRNNNNIGDHDFTLCHKLSNHNGSGEAKLLIKQRAVMEALLAKLFASVTCIKAAYAELQMAQYPYDSTAIQAADEAVVDELKAISELKRAFLKKQINLSPQVTIMLAEIKEQQSLMKTYEITIKKMESQLRAKETEISNLRLKFDHCVETNKSLEKKVNEIGDLSAFDFDRISQINHSHFILFLKFTVRSLRNFVKLMVKEMELANWDLDEAAKVIEPETLVFTKPSHKCFVFESFVCKSMFEGFNFPGFSGEKIPSHRDYYFTNFKKLLSIPPKHYLSENPNSSFAKFVRGKYTQVVHAKMECSLFGNLSQRKLLNSGGCPDSVFFTAFSEAAKRVWLSNCLAFCYDEEVAVFKVNKKCRFSQVYMENVSDDVDNRSVRDIRVGFTVVPGFKIGETVVQSQVYLSPTNC